MYSSTRSRIGLVVAVESSIVDEVVDEVDHELGSAEKVVRVSDGLVTVVRDAHSSAKAQIMIMPVKI